MIDKILAALLGLIDEQEKARNKAEFVPVRTVAVAVSGGAHSPEAIASTPETEPGALVAFEPTAFENTAFY